MSAFKRIGVALLLASMVPLAPSLKACSNDAVSWKQVNVGSLGTAVTAYFKRVDVDGDGLYECMYLKLKNNGQAKLRVRGEWNATMKGGHEAGNTAWTVTLEPGASTDSDEPGLTICVDGQKLQKKGICYPGYELAAMPPEVVE